MPDVPPELLGRVIRAMGARRPGDVIEGVKEAVASGINDIDPAAKVRFTRFFNHSYNPDIIVKWSDASEQERPVYLRGSLGDALAAGDFERLQAAGPIVIGLLEDRTRERVRVRPVAQQARGTLTTQVSALDRLAVDRPSTTSLSRMVRSSLLREARGYLGPKEAVRINRVDGDVPAESLKAFRETVGELFPGESGSRLTGTADLIESIVNPARAGHAAAYLLEHPLSDADLAIVLPIVLGARPGTVDERVWSALAPSVSLQRLESLSVVLADYVLTDLVVPSLDRLHGARARLEDNANINVDEEVDIASIARWRMRNGMLTAEIGNQAVFISAQKYYARKPKDGVDARWEDLSRRLDDFEVEAVELHGLSDRLIVAGEDAQRIRDNVTTVRNAIHDDFHVPTIELSERGIEGAGVLRVDFSNSRIEQVRGVVTVRAFLLAAALMARQTPFPTWALDKLLGRSAPAEEVEDSGR